MKCLIVNLCCVSMVGQKVEPTGFKLVIEATSNKVGINMPQGSKKVLIDPSQKKIEARNMDGLYLGPVLDILTMS